MWRVTEMTDERREIARGSLAECARVLMRDETAPIGAQESGTAIRSYWLGDLEPSPVDCQVIKGGDTAFHVLTAIGDRDRLHQVGREVSKALEAVGGHPV